MSNQRLMSVLGQDNTGLPRCDKTKDHISYWKDFWGACIKDSTQQDCCDQVTCRNPESVDIPCAIGQKQGVGPNRWNELNPNQPGGPELCPTKKINTKTMFYGVN